MKMKTIEEKARRYDEVFSAAKEWYNNPNSSSIGKSYLYAVLPELKESKDSKDEMVRKVLVEFFKSYKEQGICGVKTFKGMPVDNILAWLEKQGKNNMGISEATKQELEDNLNKALQKETPESWNEFLEEQGEQKSVDGVKPKFHEGDIIRHKEQGFTCKIIAIDTEYRLSGCNGNHLPFDSQDAYELVEQKPAEEVNGEDYGIDGLWHAQRILEKTLGEVDGYQSDDGILEHKCAFSAVKKLYEQKPAWSEEDERIYQSIMDDTVQENQLDDKQTDWLKSLKDRYTWKQSDEQMEAVRIAAEIGTANNSWAMGILKDMHQDLKKLMEK